MSAPEPVAWRGRAFGLDLLGDFEAPGLDGGERGVPDARSTLLQLAPEELDAAWRARDQQALFEVQLASARFAVHRREGVGFHFQHDYYGRFLVSEGGERILCAPYAHHGPWRWQRLLTGQLLPLAALLQGLEPFHASAVAIGDRALLCLGTSGAGKSSVALHLVGRGAVLLCDDVCATEECDGKVVVHPGAALATLDVAEIGRLPAVAAARRWPRLGVVGGEARILTPAPGGTARPVGAAYVLVRGDAPGRLSIAPLRSQASAVLLGATFNAYQRDRARLAVQLAVCARLAATAPLWRVDVPVGVGAADVAAAIAESFSGGGER